LINPASPEITGLPRRSYTTQWDTICADKALAWTKVVMTKLGLTLNEAKTSLKDARREHFEFLGYTFGPEYFRKDGHWYLGASPSQKSVQRLKDKVGDLLVPGDMGTWPDVRNRLNRLLRGWSTYFSYGTRLQAYRAVDHHVYERVRHFLVRRHNVPGRGNRRFSHDHVYGDGGVMRLRNAHIGPPRKLCGEVSRKTGCRKSARPV